MIRGLGLSFQRCQVLFIMETKRDINFPPPNRPLYSCRFGFRDSGVPDASALFARVGVRSPDFPHLRERRDRRELGQQRQLISAQNTNLLTPTFVPKPDLRDFLRTREIYSTICSS